MADRSARIGAPRAAPAIDLLVGSRRASIHDYGGRTMRNAILTGFVLALSSSAWAGQAQRSSVKGDYVEARTASVFAGACHFNGEVVTTGQDALMAWNITSGSWNATDLTGVRAIAIVNSEENLSNAQAARRPELILNQSASHAQKVAMLEPIKDRTD